MSPTTSRMARLISYFSPGRYRDVNLNDESDEEVLLDRSPKQTSAIPPITRDAYVCRVPLSLIASLTIISIALGIVGWLGIAFFWDTLGYPLVCRLPLSYAQGYEWCNVYVLLHGLPIILLGNAFWLVVTVFVLYRCGGRRVAPLADIAFYILALTSIYLLLVLAAVSLSQHQLIGRLPSSLHMQLMRDYLLRMIHAGVVVVLILAATVFVRLMAGQLRHFDDLVSLRRLSKSWREWNDSPEERRIPRIRINRDTKTFMKKKRSLGKSPFIDQRILGARVNGKVDTVSETPDGAESAETPHGSRLYKAYTDKDNVFDTPKLD